MSGYYKYYGKTDCVGWWTSVFQPHSSVFFKKINLWHITWWHTSWLRKFSEQERNKKSFTGFSVEWLPKWGREAGEGCDAANGLSVWQPRLLREQSRNPFDMNLIHGADWNLTRTTGVHGVFSAVEINRIHLLSGGGCFRIHTKVKVQLPHCKNTLLQVNVMQWKCYLSKSM